MERHHYPEFESLLVMHNRLLRDLEPRMRKAGLSSTGYLVLTQIAACVVGRYTSPTRAELADRVGTTPASMSILVGRMMANGWLSEISRNEKAFGLTLTDAGKQKLADGQDVWRATLKKNLDDELSAPMKDHLLRVVARINLAYESRKEVATHKRLSKTYMAQDKRSKDWKKKSKGLESSLKESIQKKKAVLDEQD